MAEHDRGNKHIPSRLFWLVTSQSPVYWVETHTSYHLHHGQNVSWPLLSKMQTPLVAFRASGLDTGLGGESRGGGGR